MADTAAGLPRGGTLREPKYASQGILSCGAAKLAVEETNFGTCRSAATVRYLFRAAYELAVPLDPS
jgi:hypothetical protein